MLQKERRDLCDKFEVNDGVGRSMISMTVEAFSFMEEFKHQKLN